jgi:hypothetical protein
MESIDVLREWKESNPGIKNIMIFVSDSLRWDYLPQSIAKRGVTFRTVASSLHTASSFPSMVTGLYPTGHGVYDFYGRLPANMISLMNLEGYNTSLWNENTWMKDGSPDPTTLHVLLRQPKRVSLEDMAPPFIFLEDEKGGHCPYGWPYADEGYKEWECIRFLRDHAREGAERMRERYKQSIERSATVFETRMKTLVQRGILEDTLAIFTSDHGELLGEYGGHFGHGEIACPEVVYVPTVFIHPTLPCGLSLEAEGILRHIDLFPTITAILGKQVESAVDGINITKGDRLPQFGYNYLKTRVARKWLNIPITYLNIEESLWDKDGGHLFRSGNMLKRLLFSIYSIMLRNNMTGIYLRKNSKALCFLTKWKDYVRVIKYYVARHILYGAPDFGREDARLAILSIQNNTKSRIRRVIKKLKAEGRI